MKRLSSSFLITTAAALLAALTGCTDLPSHEDLEDTSSVEQHTFLGDLGTALGTPVATSSTAGFSNDYTPTCIGNSAAPDASYTWTAPSTGTYTFTTAGSAFDTVLDVRANNGGASLGCNDDSGGTLQSSVSLSLAGGQTVLIVIDGYGSGQGLYRLNITGSTLPAGMHLWLRADADVTTAGGRVSRWLDQSGNGRHASMVTAARQPFSVSGALNGKPIVRFTGAESLSLEVLAQPTTFSVFVVGKNNNPTESFSMILGPGGSAPNNQLRWENGSQALFVGTGNNFPIVTSAIGNTRVYHALSARYNGSSMTVFRDGNTISSHNFVTSGPWILASVGSYYSSYFMKGDLAEVVIYDRALTEGERLSVNAYLRGKYNLP
jgi:Concanavalin A-like lectin/glucanases superfamily